MPPLVPAVLPPAKSITQLDAGLAARVSPQRSLSTLPNTISFGKRLKTRSSPSGSEFAAISNQGLIAQTLGALSPTQEEMMKPSCPMANIPSPTQLLQSVDPSWRPQSQQLSCGYSNVSNISILPFPGKPGSRTPVLPSTNNMSPFSDLKPRTPTGNAVQLRKIGQPRLLERRQGAKGIVNPVSPVNPFGSISISGQRKTY